MPRQSRSRSPPEPGQLSDGLIQLLPGGRHIHSGGQDTAGTDIRSATGRLQPTTDAVPSRQLCHGPVQLSRPVSEGVIGTAATTVPRPADSQPSQQQWVRVEPTARRLLSGAESAVHPAGGASETLCARRGAPPTPVVGSVNTGRHSRRNSRRHAVLCVRRAPRQQSDRPCPGLLSPRPLLARRQPSERSASRLTAERSPLLV